MCAIRSSARSGAEDPSLNHPNALLQSAAIIENVKFCHPTDWGKTLELLALIRDTSSEEVQMAMADIGAESMMLEVAELIPFGKSKSNLLIWIGMSALKANDAAKVAKVIDMLAEETQYEGAKFFLRDMSYRLRCLSVAGHTQWADQSDLALQLVKMMPPGFAKSALLLDGVNSLIHYNGLSNYSINKVSSIQEIVELITSVIDEASQRIPEVSFSLDAVYKREIARHSASEAVFPLSTNLIDTLVLVKIALTEGNIQLARRITDITEEGKRESNRSPDVAHLFLRMGLLQEAKEIVSAIARSSHVRLLVNCPKELALAEAIQIEDLATRSQVLVDIARCSQNAEEMKQVLLLIPDPSSVQKELIWLGRSFYKQDVSISLTVARFILDPNEKMSILRRFIETLSRMMNPEKDLEILADASTSSERPLYLMVILGHDFLNSKRVNRIELAQQVADLLPDCPDKEDLLSKIHASETLS